MSNDKLEKQVLLDNISYYLKQTGMKIGELEAKCGVSTGYISRLYKERKAKPSFEFVKTVAKVFHISIDKMVYVDQSAATPTELYLFDFLKKVEKDTTSEKLTWQVEHLSDLNGTLKNKQFEVNHPLLTYGSFIGEPEEGDYAHYVGIGFISHNFKSNTVFSGTSYYLPLPNGVVLYLMPVKKPYMSPDSPDLFAVEVWLCSQAGDKKYLCSTLDTSALGHMTDVLYHAVLDYFERPNLSLPFKEAIDAFMGDTPPETADKEETDGN